MLTGEMIKANTGNCAYNDLILSLGGVLAV
jgi:hypothetical protein